MKNVAIIAIFLGLFLWVAYSYTSPAPFSYDEADYMYAVERGFLANYLDSPSLSFPEYVRVGLGRGRDPNQKSDLSKSIRQSGDMFFYRHAHGPMYFFWLQALSAWSANEHFLRSVSLIIPLITALILYFGCLWILPNPQGGMAGILACAAYLSSPAVFRTTEIAPHHLFVTWFIVTLLLLSKLSVTSDRRYWYAAVSTTALAFVTLEVTFVLIAVLIAYAFIERRRLAVDWHFTWTSALLLAVLVVTLHPAALTKLAFAKSYIYYVYLSLHRKGPWGDVTFLDTWINRFTISPVEWLLVGIALFLWFRYRDLPGRLQSIPPLLFGALMLATMLRVFTHGVRYMLPFLPAFHLFAGIVVSGFLLRRRPAMRGVAIALICVALALNAAVYVVTHPFHPNEHASTLIAEIRQRNLGTSRLLVPHDDLPTVHYYFPNADLTVYDDELSLPAGQFDAVVRMTDPVRIDIRH